MKIAHTENIKRELENFLPVIREAFYKQVHFLRQDIRHPSLRAKKYGGAENVWQARVNRNVRFYFLIKGDTYILLNIKKHRD